MQSMGIYGVIGVLGLILGLAKEILTVVILVQGIRLLSIFIKKDKDDKNPPWDVSTPPINIDQDEENNSEE